jgi:hypothetical protein
MEVIYLILAESHPEHLSKLVKVLNGSHTVFVIHVSKNHVLKTFSSVFNADERKNVHFVKERYVTEAGGFKLIQATLNGLKFIYRNFSQTSRVILLNGQDYPIKSREYINSYFKAKPNNIFFQYSYVQNDETNVNIKTNFHKKNKLPVRIYDGEFGMSFPVWTIKIMLDFLKNNPSFLSYFKNVTSFNENFFQTLLLNCKLTDITNNISNQNLRLVKWDKSHLHPRILNGQDIELIKRDESLFATTFDPVLSFDLLMHLDHNILKLENNTLNNNTFVKNAPNSQITKQNVILFLTHKWHNGISETYSKLSKVSSINRDVHLIYHDTGKMPRSVKKLKPFVFDNSILNYLGYKPILPTLVPGSNHFPLFKFYLENPQYKYYWNIEDDVRYNGQWEDIFDFFSRTDITSDFLSCNIKDYKDLPLWYWWNTIGHPSKQFSQSSKVRSFNPIFRISNRALKFLHQELSEWSGHHEVLIPTLLKNAGFSINDIGGTGKYVLRECENKFYLAPSNAEDSDSGTVRFRPFIGRKEINKKLLYHPVKFKKQKYYAKALRKIYQFIIDLLY